MAPKQELEQFEWFVGIDWATQTHEANIAQADGTVVATKVITHSADGLAAFIDWLSELAGGQLSRVAIAIETTRGALVETLMERGAAVFAVNPKQLDRFRDRFSVAGAKDDRLDALVLQSALRTDRHLFRRLAMDEARVIQVRELTRVQEELTDEFVRLTNRLREQVYRIAPAWLALCENAGDAWFWDLVEAAGTPERGQRLRRHRIDQLLRRHRIRRIASDDVMPVLHAPVMYVAEGTVEAATHHIALLIPRLRLVVTQQRQCDNALLDLLTALATEPKSTRGAANGPEPGAPQSDLDPAPAGPAEGPPDGSPSPVAIIQSVPGIGLKIAGALVAYAMPMLVDPDLLALRANTGTAPVTRRTGKDRKGHVTMRYACNAPLREAVFHWAQCSIRVNGGDDAARRYYAALRARGHTHARALRSVGDRWLRILVAMLKSKTLYDPARFPAPTPGGVQPAMGTS